MEREHQVCSQTGNWCTQRKPTQALGGLVKWLYKTRIGPQTCDSSEQVIGFKEGQFQFIWIGADLPETNISVLFLI